MKSALKSTLTATLIAGLAAPSFADDPVPMPEDTAVVETAGAQINPVVETAILGIALAVALDGDEGGKGFESSYEDTRW